MRLRIGSNLTPTSENNRFDQFLLVRACQYRAYPLGFDSETVGPLFLAGIPDRRRCIRVVGGSKVFGRFAMEDRPGTASLIRELPFDCAGAVRNVVGIRNGVFRVT